jgi:hypothetical protein
LGKERRGKRREREQEEKEREREVILFLKINRKIERHNEREKSGTET